MRPAPISIATVGTVQIVNNLSTLALSKMFGASERYRDRATAVWHGSHAHVETHGVGADGEKSRLCALAPGLLPGLGSWLRAGEGQRLVLRPAS